MGKSFENTPAIKSLVSWQEGVQEKKYAVELAKGFINSRFTFVNSSWYAVAPFMGGYFYEVHEGGTGKGYLGSVLEALNNDPSKKYWFPCGDRAFQVMMRDGKPFGVLLSSRDSLEVFNSGETPLLPKTKMHPAFRKGTATLVVGSTMLSSGALFLISALAFYVFAGNPGPSVPMVDIANLPHSQWGKVMSTDVEEIVSKLEFTGGEWSVVKRDHIIPGLNALKQEGRRELNQIRSEIAPMPVDPILNEPDLDDTNHGHQEGADGLINPNDPMSSGADPLVEMHPHGQQELFEGPPLSPDDIRERMRKAREGNLVIDENLPNGNGNHGEMQ